MTSDPEAIARDFLRRIDTAAPGLVTALYLTGSVALGDFNPPGSDVDGVAVVCRRPDAGDLAALRNVHGEMSGRPYLDLIYLTEAQLSAQPSDAEEVPYSQDGEFRDSGACGQLNPVLWTELSRYGRTVRGATPAERDVTPDPDLLREWNVQNLRTYWAGLANYVRGATADGRDGTEPVDIEMLRWVVLGPPRLHYTLATGGIATKSQAGRYAAERSPRWAELCDRCVRSRGGEPVTATVDDMRSAAELMAEVIEDALRLEAASR